MIRKLFLDLDGVLADFDSAVIDYLNLDISGIDMSHRNWSTILNCFSGSEEEFWRALPEAFWQHYIPFTDEAKEILDMTEEYFPILLTCPTPYNGATGKMLWIKKHLPEFYNDGRWFIGCGKEFLSDKWHVLIDDADHNIYTWERNGGYGILVPRPWNNLRGEDPVEHIAKMINWYQEYGYMFAQGGTA